MTMLNFKFSPLDFEFDLRFCFNLIRLLALVILHLFESRFSLGLLSLQNFTRMIPDRHHR